MFPLSDFVSSNPILDTSAPTDCPHSSPSLSSDTFVSHLPVSTSVSPDTLSSNLAPLSTTHSMVTRSKHGIVKPNPKYVLNVVGSNITLPEREPVHYSEARKHAVWQQAMNDEYRALVKQGTWTLVPPPLESHVIGCQWIYKIKRHSDGSVARYKARLVANGNQQTEGEDFTNTFSHVIKQPTVRVVLSLAVHHAWPIKQLDVSNAFLHGIIDEDVYMRQPLGYKDPTHPSFVCKLSKALYGLRQAPRAWFSVFSGFLIQ